MIVVEVIAVWSIVVTGICAFMHRATRVPWWEDMLLDLDDLAVVDESTRAPQRHTA